MINAAAFLRTFNEGAILRHLERLELRGGFGSGGRLAKPASGGGRRDQKTGESDPARPAMENRVARSP